MVQALNAATSTRWTTSLAAPLAIAALVSTCFFYGFGVNLAALFLAATALLAAVSLTASTQAAQIAAKSIGTRYALVTLAFLVVCYWLSVSADVSFAATWVLAFVPLGYLVGSAVLSDPLGRRLFIGGVAVWVASLVVFSVIRFLVSGQRAHDPLVDPNNYASMIYLLWVPLAHTYLQRRWQGVETGRAVTIGVHLMSWAALSAVFATGSRTGAAIVIGVFGLWLVWGMWRRRRLGPWLGLFGGAVLAYAIVGLHAPNVVNNSISAASYGDGVSARATLISAALSMYLDHPLTGTGPQGFELLYPGYRLLADQSTAGKFVHSDYVQLLTEGGPIMVLLIGGVAVALVRRLWRGLVDDSSPPLQVGVTLALCAVFAHALVNFVFYAPVLALLIGLLLAVVFANSARPKEAARPAAGRGDVAVVAASLVFGWCAWGFFALDLAVYGVFQGQGGVPFARSISDDPERALAFARTAQRLNGNRGAAALAEAMLLDRKAQLGDEAVAPLARNALARAITKGRFNPDTYLQLEQHLARENPGEFVDEREALLVKALSLEPVYVPAINRLIDLYDHTERAPQSYVWLRTKVYPRIELIGRLDNDAAVAYLDRMERDTGVIGDEAFLAAIDARRKELMVIGEDRPVKPFFMKLFTASRG